MKIRVFFHSIKESLHNIFSHPLLTLASVTTMTLMLTLIGAFALFSLNINSLVHRISQEPPVEVFLKPGADEQTMNTLVQAVENYKGTLSYTKNTSDENFRKFKESMGKDASSLDYFDSSLIPASVVVKLKSPEEINGFKAQIEGVPGVERIDYSQTIGDTLIKANRWVNIGSLAVFLVLFIVAFFIISNMVRISVFSRGTEIEIMKYIGATNAYIRIPYVLEGAITGLFGAIISWIILYFAYEAIYIKLMANTDVNSIYALLKIDLIAWKIMVITAAIGMFVGMFGSIMSVRRHVKV